MNRDAYDYVVVGAGSAGCVLAHRLTEDPDVRVLLLEAGGADWDPLIHIPLGVGKIWQKRLHDWGYDTDPEPNLNQRSIEVLRGKVLGGSSSINFMAHIRGHRGDYDRWARSGLAGWSYPNLLPYFKRTETWQGGSAPHRGADGPIGVGYTNRIDPLAGRDAGGRAVRGCPDLRRYQQRRARRFRTVAINDRPGTPGKCRGRLSAPCSGPRKPEAGDARAMPRASFSKAGARSAWNMSRAGRFSRRAPSAN